MKVYYNDNEEYCCRILKARMADGQLPAGTVDSRSIKDVPAYELRQYQQIHLFAGIGGFPLSIRWADVGSDRSLVTAGFPCQDISIAGLGAGLEGEHSGLWWETLAAIRVVLPDVFFLENVAALLVRGLDTVLGSLASLRYSVEWHCVPASHVGAPHRRDRIWIIGTREVANAHSEGLEGSTREEMPRKGRPSIESSNVSTDGQGGWGTLCRLGLPAHGLPRGMGCGGWECGVPRVARGEKNRVKRLKALGNAMVPQCATYVLNYVYQPSILRGDG